MLRVYLFVTWGLVSNRLWPMYQTSDCGSQDPDYNNSISHGPQSRHAASWCLCTTHWPLNTSPNALRIVRNGLVYLKKPLPKSSVFLRLSARSKATCKMHRSRQALISWSDNCASLSMRQYFFLRTEFGGPRLQRSPRPSRSRAAVTIPRQVGACKRRHV